MKNTCRDRLENFFLPEIAAFLVKKELLDSVLVIFRVNEVKSQERKLISMHNVLIPSRDLYSTFFRSSHTIFWWSSWIVEHCTCEFIDIFCHSYVIGMKSYSRQGSCQRIQCNSDFWETELSLRYIQETNQLASLIIIINI